MHLTGQENMIIGESHENIIQNKNPKILEEEREKIQITSENFKRMVSFRWQWAKKDMKT